MCRSIPPRLARLRRAMLLAGAVFPVLVVSGSAVAYEKYSENRDATNCRACHGDFRDSPYVSLSDGQSWGDDLHDVHRNTMLSGDCDVCHENGPRFPVLIEVSAGGDGLAAISCVGCHGRSEGGNPTGRGLRQHHWRSGETACLSCHSDSNPSNATAVGEDILPPYYANPGNGHANMPTDSCNPAPGFPEDFAATTLGLDNDGDLSYDQADPDCVAAVCGNGQLESGEDCDDGNTVDGDCCSSTCTFEPVGSSCDDGLYCNVGETCDGAGACGGGGVRNCGDGVGCTVDSCDEGADQCVNAPDDSTCDDGVFCNGVETCDPTLDCQGGTAVDCDDADICTDDACNESAQGCDNVFDPTNDPTCAALVCGNGALDPGEDCDDGNSLDGDCCSSTCTFEPAGSSCDDGLFCNVGETCDGAGACGGGGVRDCGDGVGCTVDSCDEAADQCVNAPDNAACDDGVFCNGVETCDPTLDCQGGTAADCDDADICTDDACNESAQGCDNVFDPTNDPSCAPGLCGNGQLESGEDCDDGNTVDGDCCSSTCTFEPVGSNCDDGLYCNVGETCNGAGACGGGGVRNCGDGVGCTVDSCDEGADQCVNAPDDSTCDDGVFCNGVETCDPTLDCQGGTAVDCDDADICTDDACNESVQGCDNVFDPTNDPTCAALVCGNGALDPGEDCDDGNSLDGDCCSSTCTFEPAGSSCDDGLFCNVGETCDGAGACGGGGVRDCGDGVGCTVDSCDEGADQCVNAPDNAACDDGVFCNGVETCDPTLDCQGGTAADCDDADICTDDACNESAQGCDNVFDPTNDPSCQAICPDDDGDGFSPAGGACGAVDCDDDDDGVNPGAAEICDDDKDNDCNGLIDAADDACDSDGEWTVRAGPLEDPTYAGSDVCAGCHEDHFEGWIDSLHARILIRPGDAQAAGFPLPPAPNGPLPGDGVELWSDVLFVVGQKWKTSYVDRSGLLQDTQWNYHLGQFDAFDSPGNYDCGACHTTGYDPDATFLDDQGRAVAGIVGSWVEYNVGCEACHGPGADHAADPSRGNINRITYEWYDPDNDGTPDPVDVRSSVVCGNCHYRNDRRQIQNDRKNNEQYNDWLVSGHATSLESTTISTYCAKCHSPGNAEFFAAEHNFTYFEPGSATHVTCISCHDPHRSSDPTWAVLEFPSGGSRRDPRDSPAAIARYRGTDGNVGTRDYDDFDSGDTNALCQDCHRQIVGFRRHIEASPDEEIVLEPPFAFGQPFVVPHREHVEDGNAECVDCHMHYSRESINRWDIRSHSLLPNEWEVDPTFALPHYSDTCGQCHSEAQDCEWCHLEFGGAEVEPPAPDRRRDRNPGKTPSPDRRGRRRSP